MTSHPITRSFAAPTTGTICSNILAPRVSIAGAVTHKETEVLMSKRHSSTTASVTPLKPRLRALPTLEEARAEYARDHLAFLAGLDDRGPP